MIHLAFYRFFEWPQGLDLSHWRTLLKAEGVRLGLCGTILVSPEGINGFVAAQDPQAREFQGILRNIKGLEQLEFKESFSQEAPYRRFLVKIKKEIISLDGGRIDPRAKTGKRLEPEELKQWYESGKPFTIIDTRNDYEVKLGTFEGALDFDMKSFREFPEKLRSQSLKDGPVVMFCTGGIRCEKATAVALDQGLPEVYQLEGGILRYFEKVGGAHYKGDCFVFDRRVTLRPDLSQGDAAMCFACRTALRTIDLQSEKYVFEKSCPHCWGKQGATSLSAEIG